MIFRNPSIIETQARSVVQHRLVRDINTSLPVAWLAPDRHAICESVAAYIHSCRRFLELIRGFQARQGQGNKANQHFELPEETPRRAGRRHRAASHRRSSTDAERIRVPEPNLESGPRRAAQSLASVAKLEDAAGGDASQFDVLALDSAGTQTGTQRDKRNSKQHSVGFDQSLASLRSATRGLAAGGILADSLVSRVSLMQYVSSVSRLVRRGITSVLGGMIDQSSSNELRSGSERVDGLPLTATPGTPHTVARPQGADHDPGLPLSSVVEPTLRHLTSNLAGAAELGSKTLRAVTPLEHSGATSLSLERNDALVGEVRPRFTSSIAGLILTMASARVLLTKRAATLASSRPTKRSIPVSDAKLPLPRSPKSHFGPHRESPVPPRFDSEALPEKSRRTTAEPFPADEAGRVTASSVETSIWLALAFALRNSMGPQVSPADSFSREAESRDRLRSKHTSPPLAHVPRWTLLFNELDLLSQTPRLGDVEETVERPGVDNERGWRDNQLMLGMRNTRFPAGPGHAPVMTGDAVANDPHLEFWTADEWSLNQFPGLDTPVEIMEALSGRRIGPRETTPVAGELAADIDLPHKLVEWLSPD